MAKVRDQYADGEAARAWARFIGDASRRTRHYGAFLRRLLQAKGAHAVLDVACGTGVDSVLLLEAGFAVTSCDASDQMLKHALRTRWQRRREAAFDAWQIEEANWLSLPEDLHAALPPAGPHHAHRFDAVLCLGNSFAHMPARHGDDPQADQRRALRNFWECVRPGGVLIVDHRNYDAILATGATPKSCFYYNNSVTDIRTSVVYVDGEPVEVAMDYEVGELDNSKTQENGAVVNADHDYKGKEAKGALSHFRLTYYPHRLEDFCSLLREALGADHDASRHAVYADFRRTATAHGTSTPHGSDHSDCDRSSDGDRSDGEQKDADTEVRGDDVEYSSPADEEPAVYVHVLQKPL